MKKTGPEKVEFTISSGTIIKAVLVGTVSLAAGKVLADVLTGTVTKLATPTLWRWTDELNTKTAARKKERDAEQGPWNEAVTEASGD